MVADAVAAFGGIDVLVSNAGLRRQTPFLEMGLAEWREILSVALDGAFILARAAVPRMIPRGGGAIVALSGISTHVGTPNRCHVSASKAGLEGLMRALAIELAPHRITCNCVAPGSVDTVRGASAGVRAERVGGAGDSAGAQGGGGGDFGGGAVPGRAGRSLCDRTDIACERRGFSRVVGAGL